MFEDTNKYEHDNTFLQLYASGQAPSYRHLVDSFDIPGISGEWVEWVSGIRVIVGS